MTNTRHLSSAGEQLSRTSETIGSSLGTLGSQAFAALPEIEAAIGQQGSLVSKYTEVWRRGLKRQSASKG